MSDLTRRAFLAGLGAAGLLGSSTSRADAATPQASAGVPARTPAAAAPRGKALLRKSDFTYVGAFHLPTGVGKVDVQYGTGLTHRYVNGQLRFLANPAHAYEVAAPALVRRVRDAHTATVTQVWDDLAGPDAYGRSFGLYWDEPDNRLYWANGHEYNTTAPFNPSIGRCVLERTGAIRREGIWAFTERSCKMAMGGVLPVPGWFSETYCRGKRLAAGFGGSFSIATVGPVSMGPALTAFNPADIATAPSKSSLDHTVLVGYPFNGRPYTAPDRCHRDGDIRTEFDGWVVRDGVGYWTWTDEIGQGGVWIDTPSKSGVLFFPTLGNGRTWYEMSQLHADHASHWWYVFDPQDLGSVAQGLAKQWEIQPRDTWSAQYPDAPYPVAWKNGPQQHVIGSTYDAKEGRLYLAVKGPLGIYPGSPIVVYAYQVT